MTEGNTVTREGVRQVNDVTSRVDLFNVELKILQPKTIKLVMNDLLT